MTGLIIEIAASYKQNSVDPDQMPHDVHLIWACTVCQYHFYGTLGINGLMLACLPICIVDKLCFIWF